ncbi:hypothetical protein F5B21DRAFT_499404 [Xylaria acuta]|nr:hypothetical protein F5B21DRAFT_499404 [Xylaria acuta]
MSPIPQLANHPPPNIKGAHSPKGEMSDLIFSFDSDLDMEHDALDIIRQQSCDDTSLHSPSSSFSSASQTGYVMVSHPNHSIEGRHTFTDTYTSDASSTWSQVSSKDKQSRTTPQLSTASSRYTLPSLNRIDHTHTQNPPSSLYLNAPRESADSYTPEPTTPRTRQFKERMLSTLSLLPPGRYLSPSPSIISEDQFEDIGMGECEADDACATSPVLGSGSHSLPRSLANQGEFEERDSDAGLRNG